jgi:hypothetical protein
LEPGVVIGVSILGVFVVAWAGSFVLAGPIGKAIAQRIAGRGADPALAADLDACLAEVDALRTRVLELEERVDFAERILPSPRGVAQGREHEPGSK